MNDAVFTHTQDQLKQLARDVLAFAKEQGASAASVEISEGSGLAVTVRKGQVETIEQNKDKGIGVSVYCGQRRGHANTSDFSTE
ncbi:MAG: metalloprotease PmbA, partial [Massilia sp.]